MRNNATKMRYEQSHETQRCQYGDRLVSALYDVRTYQFQDLGMGFGVLH